MPKATDFTVYSGVVADDDHLILLDASEAVALKDKRIAIAHARKQLVRAHTSSSDPTTSDDETEGFVVGNFWLNTIDGGLFRCTDASTGAAVWTEFGAGDAPVQSFVIACSDETTDLTTGTAKVTFRMPYAFTLTEVRASVTTAPTGDSIEVDINEGGASILSTVLSIDASEKTSTTATTPAVISDSSLADDAEITIDIDQVGSSVAGAGLKVTLIGTKT